MKIFKLRNAASWLLCSLAIVLLLLPAAGRTPAQTAAKPPDKNEVLKKARAAYYVLQNQGVKSFQCVIQPDWKMFLESIVQRTLEATDPQFLALNHVQFTVAVDEQGTTTVTPSLSTGGEIDHSVDQIVSGIKQTLEGFFQTWNNMVFKSVFPEDDAAGTTFAPQGDGFLFNQDSSDTHVDFTMTKDYMLTAMNVVGPSMVIYMAPRFTKAPKDLFLLSEVDGNINKGAQRVYFRVDYQQVDGFQMPATVQYNVTLPDKRVFKMALAFSKYQITKR